MAIIPIRSVRPRMANYRRRRGLGACTAADPSGCTGPYSNPIFNLAYQQQLASSGQGPVSAAVSNPAQPINKVCQPWDTACVEANVQQQVGYQQAVGQVEAENDYDSCISNNTDAATCRARWPVGYSGEVPANNLTAAQLQGAMQSPTQAGSAYLSIAQGQDAALKALVKQQPGVVVAATPTGIPGPPVASLDLTGGAGTAPGGTSDGSTTAATSTGFSFSALPWWAWAGGAAALLFVMGKGK